MSSQRPIVSYAATPVYLSTETWKQVHAALLSQLPLRNLHWKSSSRAAIRTIQELDIKFATLDSLRDEHTSQVPQTVLDKPLLNVYFVACEVIFVARDPWLRPHSIDEGQRNVQEFCSQADQGLAFRSKPTKEPRMAYCAHCTTGWDSFAGRALSDEDLYSEQNQGRFQH